RTAFAGATTRQQLRYAIDEQVRRYESEGKVKKYEHWEFLSAVLDGNGVCRGICAMDLRTMETRTFPADAIIICTGGNGAIFGKSTNSVVCTGSAQSALYQQGAVYANGEFIQVHPTAIPGEDKLRLMSESIRGEGGRVWTYKDGQPWYFLEEKYPEYGNLVPRDIATREIFHVCVDLGLCAAGEVDYQYHGANRLGANSLLSCIYTGLYVVGPAAAKWAKEAARTMDTVPETAFTQELARQEEINAWLLRADGAENPYNL